MAFDLGLSLSPDGYVLQPPTTDVVSRMQARWLVQFLSQRLRNRGSYFVTELVAGRLKTNADIISIFTLAATQIIADMRQFAEDIFPLRVDLTDFTFIDPYHIQLDFTVVCNLGNIDLSITVTP